MKKIFTFFIGIVLSTVMQAQTSPIFHSSYFEGPDAPNIQLTLQSGGVQIDLSNPVTSNNANEAYVLIDPFINSGDKFYRFQGYLIYQAINDTIRPFDNLFDSSKMRLIAQSDIIDSVSNLSNYYLDTLSNNCTIANVVNGNNLGTQSVYQISTDAFTGNPFQQGVTYCYYAFSYAYNGSKLGNDCNLPFPLVMSSKSSNGGGIPATSINFTVTSINDLSNKSDINPKLYPNPTNERVNIALKKALDVNIQLLDITGKILFENNYINTETIPLNTKNLRPGIYFIKTASNKSSKTLKFIKK